MPERLPPAPPALVCVPAPPAPPAASNPPSTPVIVTLLTDPPAPPAAPLHIGSLSKLEASPPAPPTSLAEVTVPASPRFRVISETCPPFPPAYAEQSPHASAPFPAVAEKAPKEVPLMLTFEMLPPAPTDFGAVEPCPATSVTSAPAAPLMVIALIDPPTPALTLESGSVTSSESPAISAPATPDSSLTELIEAPRSPGVASKAGRTRGAGPPRSTVRWLFTPVPA